MACGPIVDVDSDGATSCRENVVSHCRRSETSLHASQNGRAVPLDHASFYLNFVISSR